MATTTKTKTDKMLRLGDMLRGCEPQRIQTVGYMQVIPLTSEVEDDRFSSPDAATIATRGYGSLMFHNTTSKTVIVPAQAAYVVKDAAQDHAMTGVGVVPKEKRNVEFNTAVCIQRNQGGLITAGHHAMIVLPYILREKAHQTRLQTEYSRLWPSIEQMNVRAGLHTGAQVVDFLHHFEKELNVFVAEFEPVPHQVGAIILVDGVVVGVERAPNSDFWKSVWRALIRECYGSFALLKAKEKGDAQPPPTRVPLRRATSLRDLKSALRDADEEERRRVKHVVDDVCDTVLDHEGNQKQDALDIDAWKHERFIGQTVKDGPQVVYGSVIGTEAWHKYAAWNQARPFTMQVSRA